MIALSAVYIQVTYTSVSLNLISQFNLVLVQILKQTRCLVYYKHDILRLNENITPVNENLVIKYI